MSGLQVILLVAMIVVIVPFWVIGFMTWMDRK